MEKYLILQYYSEHNFFIAKWKDSMNKLSTFFLRRYKEKNIFIHRKAEHTFLFLGLIVIHAVVSNIIQAFFTELSSIELIISFISYSVFIIVFVLLYSGRLLTALNIFILLGVLRSTQLFFWVDPYQFYIFIPVMSLVTGFIYVRKYQLYFVYLAMTSLIIFRVLFQYRLYMAGQSEIHGVTTQYMHVCYYLFF